MLKKPEKLSRSSKYESDCSFSTENQYLKSKNYELAKNLTEAKVANAQLLTQKDQLQRDYFNECVKNNALVNYTKTIDSKCKYVIESLCHLSNQVTEIVQISASATSYINTFKNYPGTEDFVHRSPNKTQAVNPMVDGHVILRPTVKLTRVNQIGQVQSGSPLNISNQERNVQRHDLPSTSGQQSEVFTAPHLNTSHSSNSDTNSENEQDIINELTPESPLSSLNQTSYQEVRLNTLRETDEERSSVNHSSSAMLPASPVHISGVFKDVRVYLLPLKKEYEKYYRRQSRLSNNNSYFNGKMMNEKEVEKSNVSIPKSGSTAANNDYDPLEGPSTLLKDVNKIDTLKTLGLEPVTPIKYTSTPNISTNSVRERSTRTSNNSSYESDPPNESTNEVSYADTPLSTTRSLRSTINTESIVDESTTQSPRRFSITRRASPKKTIFERKSTRITAKKSISPRPAKVRTSGNLFQISPRKPTNNQLTLTKKVITVKKRISSPDKRNFNNKKIVKKLKHVRQLPFLDEKSIKQKNSPNQSPQRRTRRTAGTVKSFAEPSPRNSPNESPQRRTRTTAGTLKSFAEPSLRNSLNRSPQKRLRRAAGTVKSFTEPSLRKKLRRT